VGTAWRSPAVYNLREVAETDRLPFCCAAVLL
jgi:hypothetical protein